MHAIRTCALLCAISSVVSACATGTTTTSRVPQQAPPIATSRPTPSEPTAASTPGAPRSYASVITADAVTSSGLFRVHRIKDRLLFEIPPRALGRDMLLVGFLARAAAPAGTAPATDFGGDAFAERAIRWRRVGSRVLLTRLSYGLAADTTLPVYRAIRDASFAPILASFDIAAFGPDSAVVIDVTRLFTTTIPELSPVAGQVDPARSFIEHASAFPENVEIEATVTGTSGTAVRSVLAHWSIVQLPTVPMQPRLADARVGFFGNTHLDFGANASRAVPTTYIARWRLEKRDPSAAISEPVKPIVYYIDAATPAQWRPWLKKAVLDWQPAFEAAGFRNALQVQDAPASDPNWSPDDVRHSVIRWLPSTVENAHGSSTRDPRTGEILSARIRVNHSVVVLQRDWYFSEVAPLDPRAQRPVMPDSLLGRLLEYIVSHEVGHTLGLFHNHKASSLYPADSVRSRTWVHRMGHTPSVMDYSRFNYVAQPEDSIALEDLIPRVGPYDRFAIRWGYTPVAGATTPAAERPALEELVRMQDSVPWYRFGRGAEDFMIANADPGDQREAVGDADPVQSTGYGLRNLRRTVPMLLAVTQTADADDNEELRRLYDWMVKQWRVELSHVANVVGGADVWTKGGAQPGPVYTPLSRERQAVAVRFLNANAFRTPTFLLDQSVVRRLEPAGSLMRIGNAQSAVLSLLLDDSRTGRMVEFEGFAARASAVYTVVDLLGDLHRGIWAELSTPSVSIDVFRRLLQDAYVELLALKLDPPPAKTPAPLGPPSVLLPDVKAQMIGDLRALRAEITASLPRATDAQSRMHLTAVRSRIDALLDPGSSLWRRS